MKVKLTGCCRSRPVRWVRGFDGQLSFARLPLPDFGLWVGSLRSLSISHREARIGRHTGRKCEWSSLHAGGQMLVELGSGAADGQRGRAYLCCQFVLTDRSTILWRAVARRIELGWPGRIAGRMYVPILFSRIGQGSRAATPHNPASPERDF